jgi:hypothetical protein
MKAAMNSIVKSMRLDHDILKVYYRTFLLAAYGLAILVSVLTQKTGFAMVIVMAISGPFVGLIFWLYEKNNLSKLYGILPLGKNEVVLGRYLFALAFGIANGITASILAYGISWIINSRMSQLEFLTIAGASFAYFCLYIAVEFPIYFEFTLTRVYIFSNVPLYLAIVAAAYLFRRDNLLQQLQQVIQYFTANPNRVWIASLGLGLLLLVISCPLSFWIHQKSEL